MATATVNIHTEEDDGFTLRQVESDYHKAGYFLTLDIGTLFDGIVIGSRASVLMNDERAEALLNTLTDYFKKGE